jgi:hypothetical protein
MTRHWQLGKEPGRRDLPAADGSGFAAGECLTRLNAGKDRDRCE